MKQDSLQNPALVPVGARVPGVGLVQGGILQAGEGERPAVPIVLPVVVGILAGEGEIVSLEDEEGARVGEPLGDGVPGDGRALGQALRGRGPRRGRVHYARLAKHGDLETDK